VFVIRITNKIYNAKGTFICLGIIVLISLFITIRHYSCFGAYPGWDSKEFIAYGKAFAQGQGLSHVIYRPPIYPLFIGIMYKMSQNPIKLIVIIQHFLLVVCVVLVFIIAKCCNFDEETALLASFCFAVNALVLRMAQFIMSEVLFLTLLLFALALFFQFYKRQDYSWAVITGIGFSIAMHTRQLVIPVFCIITLLALFKFDKNKWRKTLTLLATFIICNIPWSVHNYYKHGHFGLSAHLGINIFTKLTSFRLEKKNGKYFSTIQESYTHVLTDLDLTGYTAPFRPEDRWDINRIPHVLSDTLIRYHGLNFSQTSKLLTRISLEGFAAHPIRYFNSIIKTMITLLNNHIELYPKIVRIIPISSNRQIPKCIRPFLRGIFYISGSVIFVFMLVAFYRKNIELIQFLPVVIVIAGYGLTSAIQVGFTRYTVPWIPFLCICNAFIVTSVVKLFDKRNNS
jgi:4-amino-4-deoxy-L-arabinose transferase-like glycosyltransferase